MALPGAPDTEEFDAILNEVDAAGGAHGPPRADPPPASASIGARAASYSAAGQNSADGGVVPASSEEMQQTPDGVSGHLLGGPCAQLREAWRWIDADGNRSLNRSEFQQVGSVLGIKNVQACWAEAISFTLGKMKLGILDVTTANSSCTEVGYAAFVHAYNIVMGAERRQIRGEVRTIFFTMQTEPTGLTRDAVAKLVKRVGWKLKLLRPAFDLEADWRLMLQFSTRGLATSGNRFKVAGNGTANGGGKHQTSDDQVTVNFQEFEKWWKYRMGLSETSHAVIPELFEYTLAGVNPQKDDPSYHTAKARWIRAAGLRRGVDLWRIVKTKLPVYQRTVQRWGSGDDLEEFYGSATAIHSKVDLPWWIRDYESTFSCYWDVLSVFALFYVCITVPIRSCFPEVPGNHDYGVVGTTTWWIDTLVDLYFISDLVLNFFTAFPDPHDGTHVCDRREIAKHYAKGWLTVDLVSCIPVQYIAMAIESESTGGSVDVRFLKAFRLLRLSKMLRIARLKRILEKYEDLQTIQQYGGVAIVICLTIGISHVLACLWYVVGEARESGVGWIKDERLGWVHLEWGDQSNSSAVGLVPRYFSALYNVVNILDRNSETLAERVFALIGWVFLILVEGAVAGVMSALMISMQGEDQEYHDSIRSARAWLKEQKVPKERAERALEYLRGYYKSQVATKEHIFLEAMTPPMKIEFLAFLYSKVVAALPLFKDLSAAVIRELCAALVPIFAVKDQVIFHEGTTGHEMYIVISGELEVLGKEGERLGFLSDGAFFGELPLLEQASAAEIRRRTVKAVTACKLCFLSAAAVQQVSTFYPELRARLRRCAGRPAKTKGRKFHEAMDMAVAAGLQSAKPSSTATTSVSSTVQPSSGGASGSDQGKVFARGTNSSEIERLSALVQNLVEQAKSKDTDRDAVAATIQSNITQLTAKVEAIGSLLATKLEKHENAE